MKYMQFVKSVPNTTIKRVYLIVGENTTVVNDLENLLYRKVKQHMMAKYGVSEIRGRTDTVQNCLENVEQLFGGVYTIETVLWKKGVLSEKEIADWLVRMRANPRKVFVILDRGGDLEETFRKAYPPRSPMGAVLEANLPYDLERFVEVRLGISGIKIDSDIKGHLGYTDLATIIRIVRLFEHLHQFEFTKEEAVKYNLLGTTLVPYLVGLLFDKGKMAVLKHPDFLEANPQSFRGMLQYWLITLLKLKHISGKVQECAVKMGLPVKAYKRYKKLSDRLEYSWLVDHLMLVLEMKSWMLDKYSGVLLLNYW